MKLDGKCSHIFVTYKIGFDANIHHFDQRPMKNKKAWADLTAVLMFDKEEAELMCSVVK